MSRIFTIVPLVVLAAVAVMSLGTGCSLHKWEGEELGVLGYSFSSSQCVSGCLTDTPVLLGSSITVEATLASHTADAVSLRVADESLGSVGPSTLRCACDGNFAAAGARSGT